MATSKRTSDFSATVMTLQSLTDLLTDALFLIDRTNRIILANKAAQTITDLTESALLGQPNQTKSNRTDPPSPKLSHSATFVPLSDLTYFAELEPRAYALVIVTPDKASRIQDHTTATIYLQIIGQLTMRIAHDLNNSLTSI